MSAGHTPTPWLIRTLDNFGFNVVHYVGDDKFDIVRVAKAGDEANADLICRAVNAHDGLVEALQWALDELNGRTRYDEDVADQQIENCYRRAEAALFKALTTGGEA